MKDQREPFALLLREQLMALRAVAVQGCGDGVVPAALPQAVHAARLLAGSSELLGDAALTAWLGALRDFLERLADRPEAAAHACELRVRRIIALQERLVQRFAAGAELASLLTPDSLELLHRDLPAAGAVPPAQGEDEPSRAAQASAVRLEGLDDGLATLPADDFLDLVERLVTRVPLGRADPAADEPARQERQQRWRAARRLCDLLFQVDGAAEAGLDAGDDGAVAEMPGAEVFATAMRDGYNDGLAAGGARDALAAEAPVPWTLSWRAPALGAPGEPLAAERLRAVFPEAAQRHRGRVLGLIAADLFATTGPAAPPWRVAVEVDGDRLQVEFRRPPGRLRAEAARALQRLLEQESLLESPNLRAALVNLRGEGLLADARFDARGGGRLRLVLATVAAAPPAVLALPLGGGSVALPIHLVEEVEAPAGWEWSLAADGEAVARDGQRRLLVDPAAWVDEVLPLDREAPGVRLVLAGQVEKRIAILAAGPPERVAVRGRGPAPPEWAQLAAQAVELADGATLPLLDLERIIALRLSGGGAAEALDGAAPEKSADKAPGRQSCEAAGPAGGLIALLAAARARADVLGEKLRAAGFEVALGDDPAAAVSALAAGALAVVADDVPPSRHLSRLRELLEAGGGGQTAVLILAAGGLDAGVRARARALGAAGVWAPPFLVDELRELLAAAAAV